ncbi:RNA-directed DNA polymerase protein [Dioscorea alata]|uniref:RNA-directed DNA polymerase protein n=1 Tax=Dioscorea alata TaxID=55571 RepID=A0ACB7UXD7_DIOAL|nr:RNA-directed DNA polymerase protein [Dioscorea alata]
MFAVSVVSRFMNSPSAQHFGTVKRILRYVSGTLNFGLLYTPSENFCLIEHSDSDWGNSLDDRRSTTGWCFTLGSAVIAWSSKKQAIAALSSSEAEYITLSAAACETV